MRRFVRSIVLGGFLCLAAAPSFAQLATGGKHVADTASPKFEKQDPNNKDAKPEIQKGFLARHESFNKRVKEGKVDLLFIGDSITQGWEGAGKSVWSKLYTPRNAVNLGIGGDRTQHVIWRLQNGNIDGIKPKAAVVMIGTNNGSDSADQVADGITAVVAELRKKLPETKVLILGIFPRGEKPNGGREKNDKVNAVVAKLADDKNVFYLDIGPKFLGENETISKDIMPDYLHLSPKGYEIWGDAIEPTLKKLLGEQS
ncbi:MAG: platelet-activating factor acetylhydrolase IB subunit [Pirellulales bacterium]